MAYSTLDFDRCYRAVESRDARFDGWFTVGVTTTGIYCRPSCPTPVRPKPTSVEFFASPAAAQAAGLRACKRCRPDASPGSPEWDTRADLAGRAMRLIADGVLDREGVQGVAKRLAVSRRHLHRILTAELGAGPLALARANRAQTARTLIETTDLRFADVAFASGFTSVRQFNDTIRDVFVASPRALRKGAGASGSNPGGLTVRLPFRQPLHAQTLLSFLASRAVPGVEEVTSTTYRRTLDLPGGTGVAALTIEADRVTCRLHLDAMADLQAAVRRCRRLLDLDADPIGIDEQLGADADLGPLVARRPGLRAPGAVDGFEVAVRAVLGQQVTVAAARTLAGRLAGRLGTHIDDPDGLTTVFPDAGAVADAGPSIPGMPARRAAALHGVAVAVATGRLDLSPGSDREHAHATLMTVPGIGTWTADYVTMRALGDPDRLLVDDIAVRRAAARLGLPDAPASLARRGGGWSPWRSYATHHLHASLHDEETE